MLRARELLPAWTEQEQFALDQLVTVWIEPEDEELRRATSLKKVMDLIDERAKVRGLTPEKLDDILNDVYAGGVARGVREPRMMIPLRRRMP